jgi:hypothetical protein
VLHCLLLIGECAVLAPTLHAAAAFAHVQVKAGTIFDNILVCDDAEFAKAEAEKNIVPLQAKEKEMKKQADDEEAEKRRKEEVCVTPAFWGSVLPAGETYSAERVGDLWLRPVPHWQLTRRLSCHYTRIHANTHTHTLRQSSGEC